MRSRSVFRAIAALSVLIGGVVSTFGQIPIPDDAPQPKSPEESAKCVKIPEGYRLDIIASEPLVREPSGVCWDEQGRLYVSELHGFNVDGQIDIDELNKTGKLDMVVRRFFVPEHVEEAAKKETYGTIKRLSDTDGDGRMDKSVVFADRLPASFGLCPARGGLIVVCAPDILFLADRDGDGQAEVQEVLFTGFPTGVLDRRMGDPKWGLDDWIYVGRAFGAAKITGPHMAQPVDLPDTNFRIKPDGSAIEPVSGQVGGLGFTFNESGDTFVSSIGWPAHLVVPLPWHSLARNPYVATPPLTMLVFPDRKVYPTSKAHPWRSKRAEDPGFAKFYTDGWGVAESQPNGYFTSCCAPLVYQDSLMPELRGQLLASETAQNLIHRSVIEREGSVHKLHRAPGEEASEFFTSTDTWFHPIALSHGPDGGVWITDFYREIIEDYSAIPRYLQQQYGVTNGKDHGRIWRLVRNDTPPYKSTDMSRLSTAELVTEVGSPLYWRRETARRLILERKAIDAVPGLEALIPTASEPAAVINALHTLDSLGKLSPGVLALTLRHPSSGVRRQSLQLAEARLNSEPTLLTAAIRLADDPDSLVQLQAALSLGASQDPRVMQVLAHLAREHGDAPWMATAILTSLSERGAFMLSELLSEPEKIGQAHTLLGPLCAAISARHDAKELSSALVLISEVKDPKLQATCLSGIRQSLGSRIDAALSDEARNATKSLARSEDPAVQGTATLLVRLLRIETPEERSARVAAANERLGDVASNVDLRIAAVGELITEDDPTVAPALVASLPSATPKLRDAILDAIFWRTDRIPPLLDGLEKKTVAPSQLSAVQRNLLLNSKDETIRNRASKLFSAAPVDALEAFPRFAAALQDKRDTAHGQKVFRETCGKCHQAHGVGVAVGPDLSSEFQRAEETIIKDILAPSETISPGYMIYTVATKQGQTFTGLLASESPTSLILKQPEGKQQVILRNEIDELRASPISMMPEDLVKILQPRDLADVIAWLRQPQQRVVLLDDNASLAAKLTEGDGTAEFTTTDKYSGESCLLVTPLQRSSARIDGWAFKIRETPGDGEYRYIRFAWKAQRGTSGVMLELAADGQWPAADETTRRYFAGKNLTPWQAVGVAPHPPGGWVVLTRDLWKDFGDFTLTGIAPTAIGGPAMFDRMELLKSIEE